MIRKIGIMAFVQSVKEDFGNHLIVTARAVPDIIVLFVGIRIGRMALTIM